ncbi:MAG TPA: radical SAM protein [Firmicutes bacterium]|nr:radical SAM protein [Bacillota bacterium]
MGPYNLMKKYLATQIMEQMLNLIAHNPERNLVTLFRLGEKIAFTDSYRKQAAAIRKVLENPSHPTTQMVVKALREMHPNCRNKGIVNFFINALLLGQKERMDFQTRENVHVPFLVVISPTMRCNLRCIGCYAGNYEKQEGLDFATIDRIVTEAKSMGIHFITISGGEPFIREDLFDIYKKHDDVVFMIYTNGTLIDKSVARKIVELGNVTPAISVEGFEAETDARRGKGVFARIMEAMDNLRSEGAVFAFSVTATRNNIDTITSDEFMDMLISKGAIYGWYFTFVPVGKDADPELMPTPEQRNRLRERVNYFRTHKPVFVADFWNDGPFVGGCIAGGRSYLHINSNGDIEPCVFTHFAVDNIKDKTLLDALRSPFFAAIQRRQPFNKNHLRPCMIIDNPHILREVVRETGAHPTHDGAETVITNLADALDSYAESYGRVADPVWATEYPEGREQARAAQQLEVSAGK